MTPLLALQAAAPILVEQANFTPVTLALLAAAQVVMLALITWLSGYLKDQRDAERILTANAAAAKLKSDERQEEWRRQDIVSDRAIAVAAQAAEAARLLVETQHAAARQTELLLRTTSHVVTVSEENGRKSDQIINGVAKVHELTNSTNAQLQKSLDVMTERVAASERLISQLLQQIKDTAMNRATSDLQVAAALQTTPPPTAGAQTLDTIHQSLADHDKWERAREATLAQIEVNTADTAAALTTTKKP